MAVPALHTPVVPDADAASTEVTPSPEVLRAEMIDAWWDDVAERVSYLLTLMNAARYDEALTLCAAYLEGIAHALVSMSPAHDQSFADELEEHSSDPYLTLVHPIQLVRVTAQIEGLSPSAVHGLSAAFPGPEHTLLYKEQAVEVVRATLATSEARVVERAIWRCTVAYVIYDFIRSQSFRRREGSRTIGLGSAFREGETVRGLSVPELVSLLFGMIAEGRARSHATGMLPDAQ